jgi:hypothetical protein
MFRILSSLALLAALLTSPVFASAVLAEEAGTGPAAAEALAAQNLAIATSVQDQLLACWSLPSGYADKRISVGLAFFGDGTLDGDPYLELGSIRTAGQYPALMQSIVDAILACLPFKGLEELGALPGERFDITVHFQS